VRERLERLLGARAVSLEPVAGRGYTLMERRRAVLDDGRSVFVKLAVDELTADFLRDEHVVYARVRGAFMPEFIGYDERNGPPLLVLEDLSAARWPPPWRPEDIDAVRHTLSVLAATQPPRGIRPTEDWRDDWSTRWDRVAADPEPFLALGLCSAEWLDEYLPALRAAAYRAPLEGDSLVHLDVRSDNTALTERGAVLVDWNWASKGNALVDIVAWCPSLCVEGGPLPEHVVDEDGVGELAALFAGFWAATAGLPPPATAPRVREVQEAQLRVCLPWAARVLGLPEPG
jgi:hypothetical protein